MNRCATAIRSRCRRPHRVKTFLGRENKTHKRRVPVTASMAWPTPSTKMAERSTNRWQHRLKREHPTGTERTKRSTKSADGRVATVVATRQEKTTCPTKKRQNPLDSDRPSHGRRYTQNQIPLTPAPRWHSLPPTSRKWSCADRKPTVLAVRSFYLQ
jgi:hypothetical protein